MDSEVKSNIAFEVGFDLYIYGMSLYLKDITCQDVLNGYKAAELQHVSQKSSDKFIRKWLSVRLRCIRLNRECAITSEDLCTALKEVKGHCPITGETLTFGEGLASDWSVDRVDNEIGYIPSNILIMSRRANSAKGNLSTFDVLRGLVDFGNNKEFEEQQKVLDEAEWCQLASIMTNRTKMDMHINAVEYLWEQEITIVIGLIAMAFMNKNPNACKKYFLEHNYTSPSKMRNVYKRYMTQMKKRISKGLKSDALKAILSHKDIKFFFAKIYEHASQDMLAAKYLLIHELKPADNMQKHKEKLQESSIEMWGYDGGGLIRRD